ncbi:MAG: hypothetical protein ACYS32_05030 [Planctomycetota bacterium]
MQAMWSGDSRQINGKALPRLPHVGRPGPARRQVRDRLDGAGRITVELRALGIPL